MSHLRPVPAASLSEGATWRSPPRRQDWRGRRFLLLWLLPGRTGHSAPIPAQSPWCAWRAVSARDRVTGMVRQFHVLGPADVRPKDGEPDGPDGPPDGDSDPPPGAPAACRPIGYAPHTEISAPRVA